MTPGRPLEFDLRQALAAAMDVFWRKGYEATSMQDLLSAMSLSKSSLYQAFGSKHELFERCLAYYGELQEKRLRSMLEKAPSGMDFLRSTLRGLAHDASAADLPRGCLILNTATEFSRRDPVVSELVERGLLHFAQVFRLAIDRAQREGELDANRDPDVLARFIMTTISGLRTMIKAGMPKSEINEVVEIALRAL